MISCGFEGEKRESVIILNYSLKVFFSWFSYIFSFIIII